jgi:hypothetical protein
MVNSRYDNLNVGFGVLNPMKDAPEGKTFDTDNSDVLGYLTKDFKDRYKEELSKFAQGQMLAVCLRVEGFVNQGGAQDPMGFAAHVSHLVTEGPALIQIRARLPELNSMLPIPSDLPNRDDISLDHDKINMHPLFTSRQPLSAIPQPGDLVWVSFQNTDSQKSGILLDIYGGNLGNRGGGGPGSALTFETDLGGPAQISGAECSDPSQYTAPAFSVAGKNRQMVRKVLNRSGDWKGQKNIFKNNPNTIVQGYDLDLITPSAEAEIDFWGNGRVTASKGKLPQGYGVKGLELHPDVGYSLTRRSILEVNERLAEYWIFGGVNGKTAKYKTYSDAEDRFAELTAPTHMPSKIKTVLSGFGATSIGKKGPQNLDEMSTVLAGGLGRKDSSGNYLRGQATSPWMWSAVTVHHILYKAKEAGQTELDNLMDPKNYKKHKLRSWNSHYQYGHYIFRYGNQNNGDWSILSLQGGEFCNRITVNVGDILIKPTPYNTNAFGHGDIVWKIENNQAYLVGGNPSVKGNMGVTPTDKTGVILLNDDGTIDKLGAGITGNRRTGKYATQYNLIIKYLPGGVEANMVPA